EACDPRQPYRVIGTTVKFLTSECEQRGTVSDGCESSSGTDLTGDTPPMAGDLVLQQLDVKSRGVTVLGRVQSSTEDPTVQLASVYVSSGRCLETMSGSCATNVDCGSGEFCDAGTCKRDQRTCTTDADCSAGVTCQL